MEPRQHVSSGNPMEADVGYSRAVRVGSHVWVSGTAPVWPDGTVDPDVAVQAKRCIEVIAAALAEVGSSLAEVVRSRIFLVDADDFPVVAEAHARAFGEARPACTGIVVRALLDPRWRVEIEVDAEA